MVLSLLSIDDLSNEEQSAVKQLKQRMKGQMNRELFDDLNVFVRFLRARNLNVNAAEAMLRKHLEWRKLFQLERVLKDYTRSEVVEKYLAASLIGTDKEGSAILFFNFGQVDARGLLKSAKKMAITKALLIKLEEGLALMQKQSLKEGRLIDKVTMVFNFENLSFSVATHKETLELFSTWIVMYESNYPETLKVVYCINGSIYLSMGFSVIKRFFSGPTLKKINIFGKDDWQDEVFKLIDPEVFPAFLGGKRTDPDGNPLCKTIVPYGGVVPKSYYLKKKEETLSKKPGIQKFVVSRFSKFHIAVNITEVDSDIEWEFETASRDIGFSVLYKKDDLDDKFEEMIPKQRIDTNLTSETGMLKCERCGIYVLEFDNSYSWIFQKEVYYKISVVKNAFKLE